MPEYLILISAVACVGASVVVFYNRSNAAATGIAVLAFIAFLYGIGKYVDRDNAEAMSLGFSDSAERRAAKDIGVDDADKWKRYRVDADARDKKKSEPLVVVPRPAAAPDELAKQLPMPAPTQLNALGAAGPAVTILNFATHKTSGNYVELSGKVVNNNEFPITNIVVKCGDISFAAGDVSAVLEKVIPPKSDFYISKVRMGPINPNLPPNICQIAKFDRAN